MNRYYSTNILLCLLLSLSACTKNLYTTPEPFDAKNVEVLLEVHGNDRLHTKENVSIQVDVVNIEEQKTLYESWETYAPRKPYDETDTRQSFSDPAYTNAIKPPPKKVVAPKPVAKPKPKPVEPVIEKVEEKQEIDINEILNRQLDTINDANGSNTNFIPFNPLEPETDTIKELSQEQLDAAKALLPQDYVPPPPATNRDPLILRGSDSFQ